MAAGGCVTRPDKITIRLMPWIRRFKKRIVLKTVLFIETPSKSAAIANGQTPYESVPASSAYPGMRQQSRVMLHLLKPLRIKVISPCQEARFPADLFAVIMSDARSHTRWRRLFCEK